MDAGAFGVGAPDMAQLLARSQALVTLARGEHDPMNTGEQLARLGSPNRHAPGLGHNAHVESPELSITLVGAHRCSGGHASDCPARERSHPPRQ
jgi:pimeloyl-ACP methyl ester carboxylesterase